MSAVARLLLLLALAGCSTTPVDTPADWELQGKVSLQAGGETRVASLTWQQTGELSDIRLSGPAGMGAVDIEVNATEMRIISSEGARVVPLGQPILVDGRSLVLPWDAMANWVRGVSSAGSPIPPGGVTEDGWQIEILRSGSTGPRLLSLRHPVATLRLAISKWTVSRPSGMP